MCKTFIGFHGNSSKLLIKLPREACQTYHLRHVPTVFDSMLSNRHPPMFSFHHRTQFKFNFAFVDLGFEGKFKQFSSIQLNDDWKVSIKLECTITWWDLRISEISRCCQQSSILTQKNLIKHSWGLMCSHYSNEHDIEGRKFAVSGTSFNMIILAKCLTQVPSAHTFYPFNHHHCLTWNEILGVDGIKSHPDFYDESEIN